MLAIELLPTTADQAPLIRNGLLRCYAQDSPAFIRQRTVQQNFVNHFTKSE
jgi:hypothetical protein